MAGHVLERSNGQRFVMKGVTVYMLPFYVRDGSIPPELAAVTTPEYRDRSRVFSTIRSDGANAVRIPLSSAFYRWVAGAPGGQKGYLRHLRAVVEAAIHQHLVVDLTWWDSLGAGRQLPELYRQWLPMMGTVERMLAKVPGVVYEPFNEPHDIGWASWEQVSAGELRYWRQRLGYRGPLLLDTIDYSWSFDPRVATDLLRLDKHLNGSADVLFANHRYANASTCFCGAERREWQGGVGTYVGRFPILGTEYGNFDHQGPPQPRWDRQFLTYLSQHAIPHGLNGAMFFVWRWIDPNSMTTAGTARLTSWGRIVEQDVLSHRLAQSHRS
ncbi:MAG: cellulase family glycosylhydrolase [Acidimicrobiales bacterium]